MKSQKNKSSKINILLMLINIVLIIIMIAVIMLDTKDEPIINKNITTNNTLNEVKEENKVVNNVNTNTTPTPTPTNTSPEVAKVKDKVFETIQEAIDYVEPKVSGQRVTPTPTEVEPIEVTLLRDVTSNFAVGADKNVILNLDNHTITGAGDRPIANIDGTLEIKDGTMIGKYAKQQVFALKVSQTGKLTCTNVNFDLSTSKDGWIITNEGTLNLASSRLNYQKGTPISNSGIIETIENTYIESANNYIALYNLGTINKITDAEILSADYTLYNTGTIDEISGNTKINSKLSYAIYNGGTIGAIKGDANISNGADKAATIYNNGGTIKRITGNVNINAQNSRAIYNMGMINEISGNVKINSDGDVTVSTIYNSNPGELTIMGGTITQKNGGHGVYREGGIVTITGGEISSKFNC